MSRAENALLNALKMLGAKPDANAPQPEKKRYSERMSEAVAACFAQELRQRGLEHTRPGGVGEVGLSGAERQMSGGIGAKKVDVTCATAESGLLLSISIKTINFADGRAKNFQKNLTNRRGDMLFEAVTLHRRFPYAVIGGFFILDKGAQTDHSPKRASTFANAHRKLRLFTGRSDPAGRDEQYERLFVVLVEASQFAASFEISEAGKPDSPVSIDEAFDQLLRTVADRDSDFYTLVGPDGRPEPGDSVSPVSLRAARSAATGAQKAAETEDDDES